MQSHASEDALPDKPRNELRTAKGSNVVADCISLLLCVVHGGCVPT